MLKDIQKMLSDYTSRTLNKLVNAEVCQFVWNSQSRVKSIIVFNHAAESEYNFSYFTSSIWLILWVWLITQNEFVEYIHSVYNSIDGNFNSYQQRKILPHFWMPPLSGGVQKLSGSIFLCWWKLKFYNSWH